jgi:hypothetical protein
MKQRKITAIRSVAHWDGATRPRRLAEDESLGYANEIAFDMASAGFAIALITQGSDQEEMPLRTYH